MVFVHMTLSCRFVCVFLCHADTFIMCRFLKFSHETVEVVPQTSYKNKSTDHKSFFDRCSHHNRERHGVNSGALSVFFQKRFRLVSY